MYNLICFDIDKTLAPLNGPISLEVLSLLKRIQEKGAKILLISGKPTAYISGMVRQSGLNDILVSGGNGEVLNSDFTYPAEFQLTNEISMSLIKFLFELRMKIAFMFKEKVWIQPNEFQVTPFHYENKETIEKLRKFINEEIEASEYENQIKVYEHSDCFDVLPKVISKGNIITDLALKLQIDMSKIISVGDSTNDVSMFDVTGYSIGINVSDSIVVDERFDDIITACERILILI